jgi:hypothetical protein
MEVTQDNYNVNVENNNYIVTAQDNNYSVSIAQIGPQGATSSGGSSNTYVHDQQSASAVWTITHNQNKYPSATIVDSSGSQVTGDLQYISANQLILYFSAAFSGKAYLN